MGLRGGGGASLTSSSTTRLSRSGGLCSGEYIGTSRLGSECMRVVDRDRDSVSVSTSPVKRVLCCGNELLRLDCSGGRCLGVPTASKTGCCCCCALDKSDSAVKLRRRSVRLSTPDWPRCVVVGDAIDDDTAIDEETLDSASLSDAA